VPRPKPKAALNDDQNVITNALPKVQPLAFAVKSLAHAVNIPASKITYSFRHPKEQDWSFPFGAHGAANLRLVLT